MMYNNTQIESHINHCHDILMQDKYCTVLDETLAGIIFGDMDEKQQLAIFILAVSNINYTHTYACMHTCAFP